MTHEVLLDGLLPGGETGEDYKGGLVVREHPRTGFFVEVCVRYMILIWHMDITAKSQKEKENRRHIAHTSIIAS